MLFTVHYLTSRTLKKMFYLLQYFNIYFNETPLKIMEDAFSFIV